MPCCFLHVLGVVASGALRWKRPLSKRTYFRRGCRRSGRGLENELPEARKSSPEAAKMASRRRLGASWAAVGPRWLPKTPAGIAPGGLLGPSWRLLGRSCCVLGGSWRLLEPSWASREAFGLHFGRLLGSILDRRPRTAILAKIEPALWREHDF